MNPFVSFQGKRCLITGHTGFKGSWLGFWLCELGAEVHGLALESAATPALFDQLDLSGILASHTLGDVRDAELVARVVKEQQPDFIFHLAAQPLVRLSYAEPLQTFATNVMGTVHLLEAARSLSKPCTAVIVTTDKCYENLEIDHAYREEDTLGGRDCYSASKAAAELVCAAYRRSFFADPSHGVKIATARAGNVIGGGDWALDRIVPDCVRHLLRGEAVPVRNRHAIRPWQHVLEPLGGYLTLALQLSEREAFPARDAAGLSSAAYNFGPDARSNRTVQELVEAVLAVWPGSWIDCTEPEAVHEAGKLGLSTKKAGAHLGWRPRWNFEQAVQSTVSWYRESQKCRYAEDFRLLTRSQIAAYMA
jgi:CDP-glucose 4,6-dehydratase